MTIREIFEKACKRYEVEEVNVPFDSLRGKITNLAKEYPKDPATGRTLIGNTYYDRASRGSRNTLIFEDSDGEDIVLLLKHYFKKNHSDTEAQEDNLIYEQVVAARNEAASREPIHEYNNNSDAYYSLHLEDEFERWANGIANEDDIPLDPPISQEDYELFLSDYRYELKNNNADHPFLVTGIQKRSYAEANRRLEEIKRKWIDFTIKELLFEKCLEEELRDDLFRATDVNVEHHNEAYFLAEERLTDINNYFQLRPIYKYLIDENAFTDLIEKFSDKVAEKVIKKIEDKTNYFQIATPSRGRASEKDKSSK